MGFKHWVVFALVFSMAFAGDAFAGNYTSSAHGNSTYGVNRSSMSGYSTGNCAHCHEMHASLGGSEPSPASGSPSPFALFADNFNSSSTAGSYTESDNFCFYCHYSSGTVQQVTNYDYSRVFGCATGGVTSIMDAFNQTYQHDLHDIYLFAKNKFSWFGDSHNPCDACHNPHLAKRNWSDPDDPTLTAISLPSDHDNLYGDDTGSERMSTYNYKAPYCFGSSYEPGGTGAGDGSDMPNYVTFCQDCHYQFSSYATADLNNTPNDIDWTSSGDKHGEGNMDGGLDIKSPYSSSGGYVLSCTDCHEPHGSANTYLIRRRVNAGDLAGTVGSGAKDFGYLCQRCHVDDYSYSGNSSYENMWEYVHHCSDTGDSPYEQKSCSNCHGSGGEGKNVCKGGGGGGGGDGDGGGGNPNPIDCTDCHYHGATATDSSGVSRRTF